MGGSRASSHTDRTASELETRALTPSRWNHLERLFGERGACGGCWCMAWRLPHAEWVAGKGARNRRAFRRLVESGGRPGVLGYLAREPVAWCAVAPRRDYGFLERSRVLRAIDAQPVWSVSCLFVRRDRRRQGISAQMLRAAVALAVRAGARVVEGYPVAAGSTPLPDAFAWTGLPSAFLRAGFREVARRSAARPIMRWVADAPPPADRRGAASGPGPSQAVVHAVARRSRLP